MLAKRPRPPLPPIATALFIVAAGCSHELPQTASPANRVAVAKPLVMTIVEWDEYTGRLEPIDSVQVRARVSGYLQSIHFDEGQLVAEGDLLFVIDPRPLKADLNSAVARREEAAARLAEAQALLKQAHAEKADADAQLTLKNRQYARAKRLQAAKAASQEEVDIRESEQLQATADLQAAIARIDSARAGIATATATIETAKSNVETAELNLSYTQIRSPIAGRISRQYVTEGNLISGGTSQSTLLTTILSLDPIHCYFDADEQAFLKYARLAREGKRESSRIAKNPVYLRLIDETGFPHLGHMDFVDNRIDPNTGTMRGRAIFPNDKNLLTPGLFAQVRLPGSGRYEAVLIPDSAIGSDQTERFVYVLDEDNSIGRVAIETGPIVKGLRVIRSGIDGSETIVVRGLQRIYPGVQVAPVAESIAVLTDDGLPDDYQPVPKGEWLSSPPADLPPDSRERSDDDTPTVTSETVDGARE